MSRFLDEDPVMTAIVQQVDGTSAQKEKSKRLEKLARQLRVLEQKIGV